MKNTQMKLTGWPMILAVMLFNAVVIANGQTREFSPNPIVPIFTNNPTAMLVISNLLTAPQPPLSVPVVSRTNNSTAGTYWTMTSPAPLPFDPFPDLDVYQVSTNPDFIIDDRSVDYVELEAENASNNPVTFQPMGLTIDTNSLYLEVPTNSLAIPNEFAVILHNTIQGQSYDFLTKANLAYTNWMVELTTNGAVGNATEVWLQKNGRTNLFVWARESTGGTSFYINMPPLSQTVEDGDSVTFSVDTGGNTNLTYQWTFNGVAIDGATNSSYTINNVQDGDAGQYAVTISDGTNQQTTPAAQLTTDSSDPFGFAQTGDYNLVPILGLRQDYTFKSGNTYYISSQTAFYGKTTIEGGAVIKPDWFYGGSVQIMGTLDCQTEPYYPAILTSVDDDSVGEVLGFTSQDGPPFQANNGLAFLDLTYAQNNVAISNVQIKFADIGVTTPQATKALDIWDSQLYECDYAVANLVTGGTNNLHNVLFADCNDAVRATTNAITINGEQITANVTRFCQSTATPTRIALTNSLYFGTALSASSLSTVNVVRNPNGTNFVSEGYGNYYLAANSPLHNAGSAGISPRLQGEFQRKTTYSPVPLAVNTTITGGLTLSPQAQRYTNGAPDLGYYYDALDYTVANFTLAGGNLTILPNTTIAVRNEYTASNNTYTIKGFFVQQGSSITSHGTPTKPNIFTAEKLVQETPETGFAAYKANQGWWFGAVSFVTDSELDYENSSAPVYDFRFSKFYLPPGDYHFWSGYDEYEQFEISPDSSMYLNLQDCQFHGGRINLGNPDQNTYPLNQVYAAGGLSWINNSFENTAINLDPTYNEYGYGVNCDMQLVAYNNLFKGGSWLRLEPVPASAGHWTFRDNLFDKVNFLQDAGQPLDFDHNGYWPLLSHEFLYGGSAGELNASTGGTDGGHEVTLSNAPPYQSGAFGNFYLPVTTPLFGAGSRSPADAGLFQYTTRLDQTKEGDETAGHMVNIGLHYVAASGNMPKDTDGDGVPDYVEDANGNGIVDFNIVENINETDWQNPITDGVTNDAYNVAYDNLDLSGNGLVGRIKKALGMNPFDTSNPLTLNQIITGDEPDSVTFEVPVSYDSLTNIGGLELFVDGSAPSFQELDRATNGNSLLVWNTTYSSPSQHYIQAQFTLNGKVQKGAMPDPTVLSAMGTMSSFNSGNVMQFDPFYSTYDPSSGAILYATLAEPEANYSIEIKTMSGSHIRTIMGSTTDGIIKTNWDLTDDGGNLITNTSDPVAAVFNVTLLDPGTGTNSQTLSPDSHSVSDGNFTVAYAWDNATIALNEMWDAIENAVVDTLISPPESGGGGSLDPYNSTFNAYTWSGDLRGNPGYMSSETKVTQTNGLYDNLTDLNTRDFYFDGHGSPDSIGDASAPGTGGIDIDTGVLLNRLHNYVSPRTGIIHRGHPYRFVFLNACETANDSGWADTFGIPKVIKQSEIEDEPENVQAFLGWNGSPAAPVTGDDWDQVANTYAVFFNDWMLDHPLAECVSMARKRNPFGDGSVILQKPLGIYTGFFPTYSFNVANWSVKPRIFGYPGITHHGFIGGYDGIYQK